MNLTSRRAHILVTLDTVRLQVVPPSECLVGSMDNFSDVINSPPYTHELRSKNIICFVFYPGFKWPGIPG